MKPEPLTAIVRRGKAIVAEAVIPHNPFLATSRNVIDSRPNSEKSAATNHLMWLHFKVLIK
jgi:hypothetical protein